MSFFARYPIKGATSIAVVKAMAPSLYYDFRYPYDASLGYLLFQDTAGTQPVTTIGQVVGNAKNLGSNSAAAIAPVASASPPWNGGTVGVTMDNVNDRFAVAASPAIVFPSTVWLLSNSRTPAGTVNKGFFASNDGGFQLSSRGSDSYIFRTGALNFSTANNTRPIGTYASIIAQFKDQDSNLRINGTTIFTELTVFMAVASYVSFLVSTIIGGATSQDMDIKAVAVWDRVLTADERAILDGMV